MRNISILFLLRKSIGAIFRIILIDKGISFNTKYKILIILTVLILFQCSNSRLLTKKEYNRSTQSLKEWKIKEALNNLPGGEKGGFITTMEETYLNLLLGNPDIKKLRYYATKIKNRVRFKVSRELKSFFYLETPEGYYASEHEVIWLHLLLSWGYSMKGEFEKARVEAKICSNLLSMHWSEEGRFDDPLIRIILAGVWTMCGEWEEAQVDFRVAANMDRSLKWARELANLEEPPANLVIVLGGIGPEPKWSPKLKANPFRGFRGIKFRSRGLENSLILKDSENYSATMNRAPNSLYWYKRHFVRDNEIQDLIQDSRYSQKALVTTIEGTTRTLAGITAGVVIAAGGIALGGSIVLLGAWLKSSEIAVIGLIPIITGPVWGYNIAKDSYKKSVKKSKKVLDISRTYRFVRFLPEYVWVSWSKKKLVFPITVYHNKKSVLTSTIPSRPTTVNIVSLGYYPDALSHYNLNKPRKALGRGIDPDARDLNAKSLLYVAIEENNIDEAKRLVMLDANLNARNDNGETLLHSAIKYKRNEISKIFINHGANINAQDNYNITPLTYAITFTNPEITELLISKGANINAKDKSGWTALHHAAWIGKIKMVKVLVKNGADVNYKIYKQYRKFPKGSTALDIATICGHTEIVEHLKKHSSIE